MPRTSPARGQGASLNGFLRFGILIIGVAYLCSATPAAAAAVAAVSIFNDARLRGYSISNGHPVALFDISYDAAGGLYTAASGSVLARSPGTLRPLALQVNGGFAKRLRSGVTVDVGVIHSEYTRFSSPVSGKSYTEFYAGLAGKFVSSRIYFSPDHLKRGAETLYGEINATVSPVSKLHLEGHIGVSDLEGSAINGNYVESEFDWRLGISRSVGRISLHAAWTGRGSSHVDNESSRLESSKHGDNALTFGLSYVL